MLMQVPGRALVIAVIVGLGIQNPMAFDPGETVSEKVSE